MECGREQRGNQEERSMTEHKTHRIRGSDESDQ